MCLGYKTQGSWQGGTVSETMFLLLLCIIPLAAGHGGMMWPPSWWDSKKVPLEEQASWHGDIRADPPVIDPSSGRPMRNIKQWLTDRVYLGGIGNEYENYGDMSLATSADCNGKNSGFCWRRAPWASPGHALSLGGGCGVFGGNPDGCYKGNTLIPGPRGSQCPGDVFSFGSSALDLDFPNAAVTEWEVGSSQDVAWLSNGRHWGGYTYRLCKLPPGGKKDITEECFARNVLKFATNYTMMRHSYEPRKWWKVDLTGDKADLTQGTYPPGSAWRRVTQITGNGDAFLWKDTVVIPQDLPEGDYVLGFRWDTVNPQVWVSCANVRLTPPRY